MAVIAVDEDALRSAALDKYALAFGALALAATWATIRMETPSCARLDDEDEMDDVTSRRRMSPCLSRNLTAGRAATTNCGKDCGDQEQEEQQGEDQEQEEVKEEEAPRCPEDLKVKKKKLSTRAT